MLIAFVAMLASCDAQLDRVDGQGKESATAVNFGAYVYRGVETKAGQQGELTGETIKRSDVGFGVFGYASEAALYSSSSEPDFMYNQPVIFQSGGWTYNPLKYWPNESGARVSFFAYAPFVEVTPSTGQVVGEAVSGIIGMTHNIAVGDPLLRYRTRLVPGKDVDLCWGVPILDKTKPLTNERLLFQFRHALAQLNVQIDTDMDVASLGAQETRIYVRSLTFTGFALQGSLNLNSQSGTPLWYDISGKAHPSRNPITVYDGRADGSEGRTGAFDITEKLATLNPAIVQSTPYDVSVIDGVTETTVNLFENSEITAPVLVIPLTGTPLTVSIVYDVETADPELTGRLSDGVTKGISIENHITKEILLQNGTPMTLEAGKKYQVNLHLGLTGVKIGGSVAGWDDVEYGKNDLPENKAGFDVELSKRSTTLWRNETPTLPVVTVWDKNHQDVTAQTILKWESDNTNVATVAADGSSVALSGSAGIAHLKVTAEYEGVSKGAVYSVYVNAVTGISVLPDEAWVEPAGTTSLAVQLMHTEYGNITTWPSVTGESDDTGIITLSEPGAVTDQDGIATSSVVVTGVSEGVSLATFSIDAGFMASGVSNRSGCILHCLVMAHGKFRGYEVSPGIMYKKADGTYDLTNKDGNDPFELARYFNVNGSIGVYYHDWSTMRSYFGADSHNNIKSDSNLLPVHEDGRRWTFPSASVWETIVNGTPKAPITVNGQNVSKGYVLVSVYHAGKVYKGLLLLRDGLNINCAALIKVGQACQYSDNVLSTDEFAGLLNEGCLFLMATGIYEKDLQDDDWWHSSDDGRYYSSSCQESEAHPCQLLFQENVPPGTWCIGGTTGPLPYYPVRLVRLVNAN